MNTSHINIWMQLLGFNRDDPDRGVERFLKQIGFVPESVCALLFHADFVHYHRGMEEEYPLLRTNCAYYGIPRNKERARQDWTNHSLRELIAALKARGIPFYAGIMGSYLNDLYHHEWLSDHPELRCCRTSQGGSLVCLKRFADGTYYEDFFIEKVTQVLVDYDCAGIHLSDAFCPTTRVFLGDFSTDMVDQFLSHTGLSLPAEVAATMGEDGMEARTVRAEYIRASRFEEWIRFYEWRWEKFFKKLCDAVHAVGREVHILGMYCTDPFETRFLQGFDMKRVIEAGVDCVTANILPTSVALSAPTAPYFFHRIHLDLPLLRAQIPSARIVSMLGVQDASEEWSVLDHRPTLLERDLYTMTSYLGAGEKASEPAADGLFFCLSDGIPSDKWDFLRGRVASATSFDAVGSDSPMILWSNSETDRMIGEYLRHRRPSGHRQATEIFREGTPFGGAVNLDTMASVSSPLFVPNVDLLSDGERRALCAYGHPIVGTAPAGYDLAFLSPSFVATDAFSDYPLTVFVCNMDVEEDTRERIASLLAVDDGIPSLGAEPLQDANPLQKVLPFAKMSTGFVQACGLLLSAAVYCKLPVKADVPMLSLSLENGRHRLYLYNPDDNHYARATVRSARPLDAAEIKSDYPVLPVRFLSEAPAGAAGVTAFAFDHDQSVSKPYAFTVKIAPGGVTVVEIE